MDFGAAAVHTGQEAPSTLAQEFIAVLLEVTGSGKAPRFDDVRDHAIIRVLTEGARRTELIQLQTNYLSTDLIAQPFVRVVPLKGGREYTDGRIVPLRAPAQDLPMGEERQAARAAVRAPGRTATVVAQSSCDRLARLPPVPDCSDGQFGGASTAPKPSATSTASMKITIYDWIIKVQISGYFSG